MANVIIPNNPYVSQNIFECVWRLTRAMKKAGWTTVAHSNGTTKVSAGTNNNDSWGNNSDPLLDTYPSGFSSATCWIVMRGPSTLKIPITVAPTGSPLRGEKITQNSAEGELFGYVFDSASSTGWLVVSPRVGTFNATDTINCSISGASFTPTGTITTYLREFMFSKTSTVSDNINGQIFYICADSVAESGQLYSTLAGTIGCTATVAPGCGGTGNTMPTLGIVSRGLASSMAPGSSSTFFSSSLAATTFVGSYHVACANATAAAGVSADGSFYIAGSNNTANLNGLVGLIFTKVDDTDPGDCDPYVISTITSATIASTWVKTSSTGVAASAASSINGQGITNSLYPSFLGYQARGCPVTARDLQVPYTGTTYWAGSTSAVIFYNYPSPVRTLNHPATSPPLTREGVVIWAPGGTTGVIKSYKGRARWLFFVSQGASLDTFDNKKFLCTGSITNSYGGVVVGPWDGVTVPSA